MTQHIKQASVLILIFFSLSARQLKAQTQVFRVSYDSKNQKVLTGLLSRTDITSDTSFKWFAENMKYGSADATTVTTFQKNAGKFHVIIFAGTWCEDSQNLLPAFYRLADKSGLADSCITLIGVDLAKKTPGNLHAAFHITATPTFIIMKDGKEIGRVMEYGKYGQIDQELGEIVKTIE